MSKSPYVKMNLGTVLVPRSLYERAKKINGYTREDIKQVIIQNGEASLADSVDTMDYCEHNAAVTLCSQCEREAEK